MENLYQNLNYGIKGKSLLLDENRFNFYYPRITGIVSNSAIDRSRVIPNLFDSGSNLFSLSNDYLLD